VTGRRSRTPVGRSQKPALPSSGVVRRSRAPRARHEKPERPFAPTRGFEHVHHHWDALAGSWIVHLMPGDFYVTAADELIATILGSCVATCIRDSRLGLGGMNHFLLPDDPRSERGDNALRYGCFAIERLINELLKRGAARERFEIKVFGGGQMFRSLRDIGQSNVAFVEQYLRDEGLSIAAQDTGGKTARRLRYHAQTGRALLKHLPVQESERLREREQNFRSKLQAHIAGPVELF
jgi:chemotaxis protein CheD